MPQADIAMFLLFDALGIPASITLRSQYVNTAEKNRSTRAQGPRGYPPAYL